MSVFVLQGCRTTLSQAFLPKFTGRHPVSLLEIAGEMAGVVEAYVGTDFADGEKPGGEQVVSGCQAHLI